MNPWPFVTAAYAFCVVATALLLLRSFVAMRRAETSADALKRR